MGLNKQQVEAWNRAIARRDKAQRKMNERSSPLQAELLVFTDKEESFEGERQEAIAGVVSQKEELSVEVKLTKGLRKKKASTIKGMEARLRNAKRDLERLDDTIAKMEGSDTKALELQLERATNSSPLSDDEAKAKKAVENAISTARNRSQGPLKARQGDVDKYRRRFEVPDDFDEALPSWDELVAAQEARIKAEADAEDLAKTDPDLKKVAV